MTIDSGWQFAIDVGGTFTDCIGRHEIHGVRCCKTLSSGVVKGSVGLHSTESQIVDDDRNEPTGFWAGWKVRFFSTNGKLIGESIVKGFDSQTKTLQLTSPLADQLPPQASYELSCQAPAPIVAIRRLLGLQLREQIPPAEIRLGTTRGTNALLTRTGARTALVTTRGFADLLEIGYQERPHLFQLAIEKTPPLYDAAVEVAEQTNADGSIDIALYESSARQTLQQLKQQSIESVAICLLNAYANPAHEQRLGEIARKIGFANVSLSHEVSPTMKAVSRGDTTVVDAYLNPVLAHYIKSIQNEAPAADFKLLTSAGALAAPDSFSGKDSILSGPAGGVVGFSAAAEAVGWRRAIGFDMGGTSTDVAIFQGEFEYEFETRKAGVRIVSPMLAIETVAAGGGSICRFDGVKLVVGPDSAGAEPGPACYGGGGPLTVTDCNLFLGRVVREHFPFPLNETAVAQRLQQVADSIAAQSGAKYSRDDLAEGFLRIATANMAKAIRSISVARGFDPRECLLVGFGGAAPQHVCAVAEELGMKSILLPNNGGILSAVGASLAKLTSHQQQPVYSPLNNAILAQLAEKIFPQLVTKSREDLNSQGATGLVDVQRSLDLRYVGTDSPLTIHEPPTGDWADAFHNEHERVFGYRQAEQPIEVVVARVQATEETRYSLPTSQSVDVSSGKAAANAQSHFNRGDLSPGEILRGPCVIAEEFSTIVIQEGWTAEVLSQGELLLGDQRTVNENESNDDDAISSTGDVVELELYNNAFAGIAEQMGVALRRTASSVNVKERLDFSCAIFSPLGEMVVNAPHIPVHLGAMSETVKHVLADNPDLSPGDVIVTNDPFRGGSHLPDITVVTPVHSPRGDLLFLTASRAHHAEIGGVRPGSMPPFSKNLAEEGVLISNFKLIEQGNARYEALRELLTIGAFPSRDPAANLADIHAQVAANRQGAAALLALCESKGVAQVQSYMQHIQSAAEKKMRSALGRLANGRREFTDTLDDGSAIQVAITIEGEAATIDFSGSSVTHAGNFNANRAIVSAAVMYVMRCLIDEDIPLNEGVLAPIELIIPNGILNPVAGSTAELSPAVVAGNVETSQRVVDVLLGALQLAAASQGTMNNLLFGNEKFGYYETICGGAGATPTTPGASAIQTHMTNTRLTDPEVLESRYGARVLEFSIRNNSGGRGQTQGGNGVVRKIEFLEPLDVSLLTSRRGDNVPFGLAGGEAGKAGCNRLVSRDGESVELHGCDAVSFQPGDILIIETPGGGGFGPGERGA